jgi:hypothetical protein
MVISPETAEGIDRVRDSTGRFVYSLEMTDNFGRTVLWRIPL